MKNIPSSIRDNHKRGCIGNFLKQQIDEGSNLSIVSAYFTIYAYQRLKDRLNNIESLYFLFGEPTFIKDIDPSKTDKKEFKIEDDKLVIPIESRLQQKSIAKECGNWIRNKVNIRSMVKPNFLHGKMYHVKKQQWCPKSNPWKFKFYCKRLGPRRQPEY